TYALILAHSPLPHYLFTAPPTTQPSTLSLHDALPISAARARPRPPTRPDLRARAPGGGRSPCRRRSRAPDSGSWCRTIWSSRERSEEHTSELQSRFDLVCRLLLEKKKHK